MVGSVRVGAPLAQVFDELLTANQNVLATAMRNVALQQDEMQARIDRLVKENAELRAQKESGGHLPAGAEALGPRPGPPGGEAPPGIRHPGVHAMPPTEKADFAFVMDRTVEVHSASVHSVCIASTSEGQQVVASASWDATVKLYDYATRSVVRQLGTVEAQDGGEMGGLYAVAIAKTSPSVLACTSCDQKVYLWNQHDGTMLCKLQGHKDEVNGIDFHSEQHIMCTASDDQKVIIWDFKEGILLRTLEKHTKAVYGCTFLGNQPVDHQYLVATCCFDRKTRIFDMRDKRIVQQLSAHSDDVIGIDWSSTKRILATGSDDGTIAIWDSRTWRKQHTINTRTLEGLAENEVKRISFTPDGDLLAAACSSGRVLVYDVTKPQVEAVQLIGHTDCVFDVKWTMSPDSNAKILVSASHDHSTRYWREVL